MPQLLVFALFFAGVYFLLLRPQQQRVRRQRELISAIGVGDRVVTAGGLIGRVLDENDDRLLLEISDGVVVEFLRLAISRRLDESESSLLTASGDELEPGDDGEAEPEAVAPELAIEPEPPDVVPEPTVSGEPGGAIGPAPTTSLDGPDGSTMGAATPGPGQDPH